MGALVALLGALTLHPLHTTLTQLAYRDSDHLVEATVRVFADDFRAALRADVSDSAAVSYLRSTFTLADRAGRPLSIAWCGLRRTGDLLWLCLRAGGAGGPGGASQGLSGMRVRVALLFERYADQINIVQASYAGRRAALLFTSGDAAKALP